MRILYISQYFPPEVGATQTRAVEMARGLVRAGHRVTMIAEFPCHPHGIMPAAYRGRFYERVEMDGIDVIRVWVKASPQKGFRARMSFYLSFMMMAITAGLFLARGRYNALYATSPPLFVGAAALVISKMRRVPLVFEVRDLWPDSAVQLGELSTPWAIRLATWLEEACYRQARHIVVVTKGIYAQLRQRGYEANKLSVIPNGANTELYRKQPIDYALQAKLGLEPDQFVVIYTGLHGLAHGLETVLHAAHQLQQEAEGNDSEIVFLFIGDGPQKPALLKMAAELHLQNVIFHDAVPEPELPRYLSLAHVGLDSRRRIGISQGTLPVKMFSYMACELPVLLCIEGEAEALLAEAEAGLAVPSEAPMLLVEAIRTLRANDAQRQQFARNGRAFVTENFSRQKFAKKLETLLLRETQL